MGANASAYDVKEERRTTAKLNKEPNLRFFD